MLRGFLSLLVALLLALYLSAAASIAAPVTDSPHLVSADVLTDTEVSSIISATGDNNSVPEHLPVSCHDHCSNLMACTDRPSDPSPGEPTRTFGQFNIASASLSRLLRPPR